MHRDRLRLPVLFCSSAAAGWIGWSGEPSLLPAAMAFPGIWSLARTRWQASAVSSAYFLAASSGLPQGVATFYAADLWPGLLLWLMASTSFVTVHTIVWTGSSGWKRACCYLVACLVMAIPPFGITGWASPLTAAGALFAGWCWLGLIATAAGLAAMTTRLRPAAAVTIAGFWLWSAATWTDIEIPNDWRGVELEMGSALGRDAGLAQQRDLLAMVARAQANQVDVVILPEGALGFWTPTVERLWRRALAGNDVTILAGASVADASGYDNVLVQIGRAESRILYRQRMPVPIAMWQPWRTWVGQNGGAHAHAFQPADQMVGATRVAVLICYEQLLVWPVLQSMSGAPDIVVAIGNGWWTSGTSIVDVQRAAVLAWARLFAKPVVFSFNT